MDFAWALQELKGGCKISRSGWNGRNMYLILVHGTPSGSGIGGNYCVNPEIWGGELLPWIGMKTSDNKFVPWLASQTDLLADDWNVPEMEVI